MTSKHLITSALFVALAAVATGCSNTKKSGDGMASASSSSATATDSGLGGGGAVEAGGSGAGAPIDVVYFGFDSNAIPAEELTGLNAVASRVRGSSQNLVLEGHTDERGSNEYNLALGERRANAVREYLTVQGINGNNLESLSYGEERPAESGSNEGAWSKNRRVEVAPK